MPSEIWPTHLKLKVTTARSNQGYAMAIHIYSLKPISPLRMTSWVSVQRGLMVEEIIQYKDFLAKIWLLHNHI